MKRDDDIIICVFMCDTFGCSPNCVLFCCWAKYVNYGPLMFPSMIAGASGDARAGDLVTVYTKQGQLFGKGLYDPNARLVVDERLLFSISFF